MPAKISEKNVVVGFICLAIGIIILLNTTLFAAPIRVSEKGIVFYMVAFVIIAFGVRFFKRSAQKV